MGVVPTRKRRLAPQKHICAYDSRRIAKSCTFSTCCFVRNGYGYGCIHQYSCRLQLSGNNVSIVLRIVRYSRQIRQNGRRERQNVGNVLAIFHMVSHMHMEEWLALSAVQSIPSQLFHSQLFTAQNASTGFPLYYGMQTTTAIPQYSDSIMYKHLADV